MEKIRRKVNMGIGSVALLVIVLAMSLMAFITGVHAWFASNNEVDANGMLISASQPVDILIKQNKNGDDVSVVEITEDTVHMENHINDDEDTIQPGSSGYFTFCLEYNSASHEDTYSFTMSVKTVNSYYKNEFHGFFENKESKLQDQEDSLLYINSHLLFFKECEDGVYSNWLRSEEEFTIDCTETETDYVATVTIYWIWVQDYADLFTGTSYINSSDTSAISTYYSNDDNKAKMFSEGYVTEDSYNVADYIIGTTLQYICFELNVR